jgi:glycerol uptake facilitator protein
MNIFTGEIVGTFLLILLGNGVVANVILNKTKGHNSGWLVITFGWAMAVFVGVFVASKASGAHLNPAVTIALATLDKVKWSDVPWYLGGQVIGAMMGCVAVWGSYFMHLKDTNDAATKLAVFATSPAIRNPIYNLLTEIIATFVLILAVLFIITPSSSLGALDALPVALVVLGIGLSLGGPTGYAINPVRDFVPRFMHAILPMGKKGSSDWKYCWIPIVGPVAGSLLAALIYHTMLRG